MQMDRKRSQLLVIDVQERLAPHVATEREVIANVARLLQYAQRLDVPATVSEHYPKGLGATVPELRELAGNTTPVLEKMAFSCWRDNWLHTRIEGLMAKGRDQVVVAGMETHVCVTQSVLDLIDNEFQVFVVADAVGSRDTRVRDIAVDRLRAAGATIVAQEMVAFEWLGRGDDAAFKDIIALVK
ncbi:MAG: hydrolase [Hyphomicrobiaceae bacterium]